MIFNRDPYKRLKLVDQQIKEAKQQYFEKRNKNFWYKLFKRTPRQLLKEELNLARLENRLIRDDFIKIEAEELGIWNSLIEEAKITLASKFDRFTPIISSTEINIFNPRLGEDNKITRIKVEPMEFDLILPRKYKEDTE